MSYLLLSQRWTRQPPFDQAVNTGAFPGMTGVWLTNGAAISRNLLNGEASSFQTSGVPNLSLSARTGTVAGRNLNAVANANTPILAADSTTLYDTVNNACSIMFVARRNGTTGERGSWCGVPAPGGLSVLPASAIFDLSIWQFQSKPGGPAVGADGGIDTLWTFQTEPQVYFVTANAGALAAYQNGVLTNSGSVNNTAPASGNWGLSGRDWDTFVDTDSSFYAVAFWRRVLSGEEISRLSLNPWQLFRPQRRRIHVPAAAPPAGPAAETIRTVYTGMRW